MATIETSKKFVLKNFSSIFLFASWKFPEWHDLIGSYSSWSHRLYFPLPLLPASFDPLSSSPPLPAVLLCNLNIRRKTPIKHSQLSFEKSHYPRSTVLIGPQTIGCGLVAFLIYLLISPRMGDIHVVHVECAFSVWDFVHICATVSDAPILNTHKFYIFQFFNHFYFCVLPRLPFVQLGDCHRGVAACK